MKLFVTVIHQKSHYSDEPEWVIHAHKYTPSDLEVKRIILKHLTDDLDDRYFHSTLKDMVENYWTNEITEVNGYKVKLVKE